MSSPAESGSAMCRVVIVGPCASGKSTLADRLVHAGYDAYVCAQEHSEIDSLWQHQHPSAMIALDVDLETIRERRGEDWPETIYLEQRRRLQDAWEAADIVINTSLISADQTFALAVGTLKRITSSVSQTSDEPGTVPGSSVTAQ